MKVLIADDDSDLRNLLTIAVERAGHDIAAAVGNGQVAWEILQDEEIDLAVLDISMPGMTGLEVVEKLRQSTTLREQHVLIITANASTAVVEKVHLLGSNGLIRKPFQMKELIRFLSEISDRV